MATSEASTSNETAPASVDINALIGKGKKHLICNEIVEAVSTFADACYHAGVQYGEKADECAESYYLYGSALLELSRMENGVLGNALSGVKVREEQPDDEFTDIEGPKLSEISEEEREQVKTDVQEAMEAKEDEQAEEAKEDKEENMEVSDGKGEEKKSEEKAEDEQKETKENKGEEQKKETKEADEKMEEVNTKEDSEEKAEGTKSSAEETEEKMDEGEKKEESGEKESEEKEEEEDEALGEEVEDDDEAGEDDGEDAGQNEETDDHKGDDVPTLQLSWEMLELAKFIYSKQEGPEARKKEAQALSKLGEISLEQEQYSQAIQDLQDCLKLVDGIYEPDSRALAEIHYNLGLAFNFDSLFEDAGIHFKKSVEIIKLKLKSLEEQIEKAEEGTKGKEKANADDPCQAAKREVKDLEALLPELNAKIEDAEEMKKTAPAMVAAAKDAIKSTIGIPLSDDAPSASPFDAGFGLEEKTSEAKTDASTTDITHLVRRKRKPEEEKSEEGPKEHVPAKKARPSLEEKPAEEINGNGEMKQNGEKVPNGDSTSEPVTV